MQTDSLEKLIKGRRSTRLWQDREVPAALLKRAVEIATWAPNGSNAQNWRFYIIVNRDVIGSIADEVQCAADLIASWPEAGEFAPDTTRWRERAGFFRSAPAAIAVASSQYLSTADHILSDREKVDPVAREIRGWRKTADTRIQSAASAIAYLLLILHSMGLGAVWMTGPMQAAGKIEKILGVPADMNLVAFIPVGYPAEEPAARPRLPVDEVCTVVR